jgi:hypothetical protein
MTPPVPRSLKTSRLLLGLSVVALVGYLSASSSAIGTVTVTAVAVNHSSAKIFYAPVAGAKDYRVYDIANPSNVKYAGLVHLSPSPNCPGLYCLNHFIALSDGVTPAFPYQVASGGTGGPQVIDGPATDIDWNNLGDGHAHTLVVEALDQLGPVPQASLYTGLENVPVVPGAMIGGNKGITGDGKTSTNGQGPFTNLPIVIARSRQFVVQPNQNLKAIPSKATASQTFYDTFENAENSTIQQTYRSDTGTDAVGNLGIMKYTMNAGTSKAWQIEYRQADNQSSMPFISSDHFMDMLFDGATPNTGAPTHTIYGSMAMTPVQTVDMSNGKVLHVTMEVDAHQSFRRWLDFNLAPASDPLQGWDFNGHALNNTNQAMFLELKDGFCTLDIYTNTTSATDPSPTGTAGGSVHGARLWGQPGSVGGGAVSCNWDQMYVPKNLSKNGFGLDDKSRLDFFISQNHAALYQDGQLIVQSDIPAGTFPWAAGPVKAYYSHYMYHSDADIYDLQNFQVSGQNLCYPLNSFWFNDPVNGTTAAQSVCGTAFPAGYGFRYSDERHWDNMGFEVLPASDVPANDFSGLAPLVQPPTPQPPVFASDGPQAPANLRVFGLLLQTLFPRLQASWLAR